MTGSGDGSNGSSAMDDPPHARVRWRRSWRLVPARFPPVPLFERVTDPADLEVTLAIEALTDPGVRDAVGNLAAVPPAERVSGPGSSPVMAAFTHPSPVGSRFAAPGRGAYYAARSLSTAIAEVRFHQARFLAATRERSIEVSMRVYVASLDATLHDVRDRCADFPDACVDGPAGYPRSAAFAGRLRDAGGAGIVYDSARQANGQCVVLFRPRAVRLPVLEHAVVRLVWDGDRQAIVDVFETRTLPDG